MGDANPLEAVPTGRWPSQEKAMGVQQARGQENLLLGC